MPQGCMLTHRTNASSISHGQVWEDWKESQAKSKERTTRWSGGTKGECLNAIFTSQTDSSLLARHRGSSLPQTLQAYCANLTGFQLFTLSSSNLGIHCRGRCFSFQSRQVKLVRVLVAFSGSFKDFSLHNCFQLYINIGRCMTRNDS